MKFFFNGKIIVYSAIIIFSGFFIFHNFILAAPLPPTVVLSGDDIL